MLVDKGDMKNLCAKKMCKIQYLRGMSEECWDKSKKEEALKYSS